MPKVSAVDLIKQKGIQFNSLPNYMAPKVKPKIWTPLVAGFNSRMQKIVHGSQTSIKFRTRQKQSLLKGEVSGRSFSLESPKTSSVIDKAGTPEFKVRLKGLAPI